MSLLLNTLSRLHLGELNAGCLYLLISKEVITGNGRNKYHLPDKETIARLKATKQGVFSLHFPNYNSTIEQIFENEKDGSFKVCPKAEFSYE